MIHPLIANPPEHPTVYVLPVSLPVRPAGTQYGGASLTIESPVPDPTYQQVLDLVFEQYPTMEHTGQWFGVMKVGNRLLSPFNI